MQATGKELVSQTGQEKNVASSDLSLSSLPKNLTARQLQESYNLGELSAPPSTSCTLTTTSIREERSHEIYPKFNIHEDPPPPPYNDTIFNYKNPPLKPYELHNVNNTRETRELWEEEAIASDNENKYKKRVKGCKRFTVFAIFLFAWTGFYLNHWHKEIAIRLLSDEQEALRNVVFVSDINVSEPYEGRLVHVIGPLSISEPLRDPECGFAISSVKLKRFVHNSEIYMMVKTMQQRNDTLEIESRYYYTRKGGDILLNSNQMCVKRKNMFLKRWDIKDQVQTAKEVKIGSLALGAELKEKFNDYVYVTDKLMELNNDNAVRLMFSYAGKQGDTCTVIGKLVNGVIVPYRTLMGDEILLQRMDVLTAQEIIRFQQFHSNFHFYRRSYVVSLVVVVLSAALLYYYKVHPLRPRNDNLSNTIK